MPDARIAVHHPPIPQTEDDPVTRCTATCYSIIFPEGVDAGVNAA
jgi:hypothetical protein